MEARLFFDIMSETKAVQSNETRKEIDLESGNKEQGSLLKQMS